MERKEIDQSNENLKQHILALGKPDIWRKSLALTEESLRGLEGAAWVKEIDTVFVVGHGTSLATTLSAEPWFSHIARLNSRAMPAHQLSRYPDDFLLHPQKTLVVGITMGGSTPSVEKCLNIANERGAATVCISRSDIEGPCAAAAQHWIKTYAEAEKLTKIHCGSISHLILMSGAFRLAVLIGRRNGALDAAGEAYWLGQFDDALAKMDCLPALYDRMAGINAALLGKGIDRLIALGTGPNMGTACEGAIKMMEMTWMMTADIELEDFAHGRFRVFTGGKELCVIICPSGNAYQKTMDHLAGCHVTKTPTIVLTDAATPAMRKLATFVVDMPKMDNEYLTSFLYVFPFWFFGIEVKRSTGQLAGEMPYKLYSSNMLFDLMFTEDGDPK